MRLLSYSSLLLVAAVAAACGGSSYGSTTPPPPPPPDPNTVVATPSLAFTPPTLDVNAGQAVTFDFQSVAHNVFFDPQAGVPSDIAGNNANTSVQRTFTTPGTYHYSCHIHPSMHGTVVVH